MLPLVRFFIFLICASKIHSSRIKIENNGYKNILISLPQDIVLEDRSRIVRNIENMVRSSSVLLQMASKGRAYFSEVTFLIPHQWKISEDEDRSWKSTSFNSTAFMEPRAALTMDEADVVVTAHGQYPYVLHQGGCRQGAVRIILPMDFLQHNRDRGVEFFRLWSEYRYGVFPEGGFPNDEKYPYKYKTPNGKEEKRTGCSDKTFWSSSLCNEGDKQCSDTSFTSSVMDQHLSPSAILFCEGSVSLGPRHNSESPSKHNLMCAEEGTLFTVLKSPDFSHGRNAAPKYLQHATDVTFRFVREATAPRIIVAIEISSKMKQKNRFVQTQASFYQFIYSTLPYGSDVTLLVFGGEDGAYIAKPSTVLNTEDSRILYVESQPLPEEPSLTQNVSIHHLFHVIFQAIEESNDIRKASPDIIVVTTDSHLNLSTFQDVKQRILETESRLHVMLFPDSEEYFDAEELNGEESLQRLCLETGGELFSLHADEFGDMNKAFSNSIGYYNKEILILQDYMKNDDMDLEMRFVVDEDLSENLKVSLSSQHMDMDLLEYGKTLLQTPSGGFLNFMRMDFLFAWLIDMTKPEIGEYILKTRRMENSTAPVLVTVIGRSTPSESPITVTAWAETLVDFHREPQPIRIYAEVKKGWHPVRGASVIARVVHPDGENSQLALRDDGLGDTDITEGDGIYGRYFTNFSAPGFYNVYVKVTEGANITEVIKGPDGFCCGSFFPSVTTDTVGRFHRETGPFTFEVPFTANSVQQDIYPPSRITDLRLYNVFDRICILRWTAVGDNFDSGFARTYELKVFRDRTMIRNRFSGSGLEVYSENITNTPEATYGTTLNHAFEFPNNLNGVHYIAIRAHDDAGNAGEPSNVVPVFIEKSSHRTINCEKEETCENGQCEELPIPAKLQENSAASHFWGVVTQRISVNVFIPVSSLVFSLTILNLF